MKMHSTAKKEMIMLFAYHITRDKWKRFYISKPKCVQNMTKC